MNTLSDIRYRAASAVIVSSIACIASGALLAQGSAPADPHPETHAVGRADGQLWGGGKTFRTRFDAGSVVFTPALGPEAPRSYPVRFTLESIRRGATTLHAAGRQLAPAPVEQGLLVRYSRGDTIQERYQVRADGVEQSYEFRQKPGGTGDLVVQLRVDTDLEPQTGRQLEQIYLSGGRIGGVTIGAVTGVAADGQRASGHMNFDGQRLELVLPSEFVERASYPMVLDPLIGARYSSGQSSDDRRPDVAYDESTGKYLVVYERWVSSTDVDIWGTLHLPNNTQRKGVFLATGSGRQLRPAVANVASRNRFMVVWQDNSSGNWDIRGRSVDSFSGLLSARVDVAATSAPELRADICGESRMVDDDVVVVYDNESRGILARSVELPPGQANPTPNLQNTVVVWPGANPAKNTPAICKGSGPNGKTCIVWQDDPAFMSARIYDMNLVPQSAACGFSSPSNGLSEPAVDGDGERFLMVYERRESGQTGARDIYGWLFDAPAAASRCVTTVERRALFAERGVDEVLPTTAFLGSRFAVAASRPTSLGFRVHVANTLPSGLTLCAPPTQLASNRSAHQWESAIAAKRSAGDYTSGEALVVYEEHWLSNDLHIVFAQRYAATRRSDFAPSAAGGQFGAVIAAVGDIDNDGYEDVAIGHPNANANGTASGRVTFVNGRTHATSTITGFPGDQLGMSIAAGDVDEDGYSDVVMGRPGAGSFRGAIAVRNGRSGRWTSVIISQNVGLGERLAVGRLDRAAGADVVSTDQAARQLRAFSSAGWRQLWLQNLPAEANAVIVVGDVNADGYEDVAVGMPKWSSRRGRIEVRSGRNGALLRFFNGIAANDEFGFAMAATGDLNGDRVPDLVAGAPGRFSAQGLALFLSGADMRVLGGHSGKVAGARLGQAVASAGGDLDGDGTPDVILGASRLVKVVGGPSGARVLATYRGTGATFGAAVAGFESNGDEKPDLMIGEPTSSSGRTYLHDDLVRPNPPKFKVYGLPCAGTGGILPRIHGSIGTTPNYLQGARGRIGSRYSIFCENVRPRAPGILRIAAGRDNLPLDFLGLPGCQSLVRNFLVDLPIAADSSGRARFLSRLDNNPSWIGGTFTYQWWFLDRSANPLGFAGSDAAEFRIGAGL